MYANVNIHGGKQITSQDNLIPDSSSQYKWGKTDSVAESALQTNDNCETDTGGFVLVYMHTISTRGPEGIKEV